MLDENIDYIRTTVGTSAKYLDEDEIEWLYDDSDNSDDEVELWIGKNSSAVVVNNKYKAIADGHWFYSVDFDAFIEDPKNEALNILRVLFEDLLPDAMTSHLLGSISSRHDDLSNPEISKGWYWLLYAADHPERYAVEQALREEKTKQILSEV